MPAGPQGGAQTALTDKKQTFCIYDGPSPEAIRKVAERSGLPVDRITEVRVLDPLFPHVGPQRGAPACRQAPVSIGLAAAGLLTGSAQLYTPDAALLPPDEDRVDGNAAIEAYWGTAIEEGYTGLALQAVEVNDGGDFAAEVGTWAMTVPSEDAGEQKARRKYVVIWRRAADGGWRIQRDIWNGDPGEDE